MANFKEINKFVRKQYPHIDIEVVRGVGYVYFSGDDGFDNCKSIYANPTTTTTADMIRLVTDEIEQMLQNKMVTMLTV